MSNFTVYACVCLFMYKHNMHAYLTCNACSERQENSHDFLDFSKQCAMYTHFAHKCIVHVGQDIRSPRDFAHDLDCGLLFHQHMNMIQA